MWGLGGSEDGERLFLGGGHGGESLCCVNWLHRSLVSCGRVVFVSRLCRREHLSPLLWSARRLCMAGCCSRMWNGLWFAVENHDGGDGTESGRR